MSTGEEQWKTLQDLERRNGRGKRRKKTLAEQLVEMGGFGEDPDSERAIEELERYNTKAPLQSNQKSVSECEVLIEDLSFWESRKRLFRSWIFQAKRSRSWIQEKDLPLFFRFALGRPIMDEWHFRCILSAMNLQLDESTGNARQPHTLPLGRSRKLLFGIDADPAKDVHPSTIYRDVLPRGAAEDADGAREEVRGIVQHDDEDMQELLRTQLWAVYDHVQDGSVPLEMAARNYRDAFDKQDMSDESLVLCLQQFGIPTDHISNNGQKYPQDSAGSQSSIIGEKERIADILNYVRIYRSGEMLEDEAIQMIRHRLYGLKFNPNDVSDALTDLENDEKTTALLIWEDACDEDGHVSSSPSSSEDDKDEEPYEDHKNPQRAILVPDRHANDERDQNAAVGIPVDKIKPFGGNKTEDLDYGDGFNEKESHKSEAIMGPPAMPSGKLSVHGHADKARSSMLPPGSPRPASAVPVTETYDSQGDAALDRELPGDRANIGRRRTSSPDEGMTTGIWGLLMPTKEARELAYKLKLPQDDIDKQVRSITPRRERRRASYAKKVVTLPKSKRKASNVLHKGTASKAPKYNEYSDLFATEGEDQETFVLSHFDRDRLPSETVCDICLCISCQCGYESSQVDKATRDTSCEISLSSDGPVTKFVDRTRAESPKQSVTLLAYLARVLDDNDVLASIKQLLIAGMEDREIMRILHDFIQSSHTLANHPEKLRPEIKEKDDSTINVNRYRDEVQEGPGPGLSLLNSSFDYKHVHVPPSDDISSAVASPEKQSKIASDTVFQANSALLAKYPSPYLPIAAPDAPDSSVLQLKSNSGTDDAAQPSRFQTAPAPDSSTARDSSRSENRSRSPGGCKNSPAGGHSSQTKFPPESPAESTLSPTADLSKQVSENLVGAVGDTDDTFGAPFTKQPHSDSQGKGSRDGKWQARLPRTPAARKLDDDVSPLSPRARAKQLHNNNLPPPPWPQWPPLEQSPEDVLLAISRLGPRKMSRERKATHRSHPSRPDLENLPLRPPQQRLAGKDGFEWMGLTSTQALDHAKEKAISERKSLAVYLEDRRAVRTRIKRENDLADSKLSDHSFFQSSNGLSGSSGTATTQALNKLFDKYRGRSNIYLRSCTRRC